MERLHSILIDDELWEATQAFAETLSRELSNTNNARIKISASEVVRMALANITGWKPEGGKE